MAIKSTKQPKLGTGKRFSNLENKLKKQGIKNPAGLTAKIGREKYGNKKMNKLAQHGKNKGK